MGNKWQTENGKWKMRRITFKLSVVIFSFLILYFCLPKYAIAATNFNTDYHVTYTIDQDGIAHAVVNGTLTNTTSQYYASSYTIQLGFDNISNIKAQDAGGPIAPNVSKNKSGYVISLDFNKQVVGLGNKQQFAISFDTPTLAHHYGRIWEIDIPGISNPQDFSTFVVELKTPPSFGQPAYIKPNQASNDLTFNKQTLGKSGISLSYGSSQVYNFHLTYHLRNTNLYPTTTQIALPPSTNYQDVSITNMDPTPVNVTEDKDGNWLAQYHLSSIQNMDVVVSGNVIIHLNPRPDPMSPTQLSDYIKPQKYWESNNSTIQQLASQLQTPQAIYNYVSDKLHYDFSRVTSDKPRLGAVGALQDPNSAVCLEFTDLFIAIARAAHIPAREVDGFAYTDNPQQRPISEYKDILHVWPEYYDSGRNAWIMVDPTWGSTTGGVDYFNTLDFDHFAFDIRGESSVFPIPAGGYNYANNSVSKDVQIGFGDNVPNETPAFSLDSTIPTVSVAGFPIEGSIVIKNNGSAYLPSQILYLTSDTLTPQTQTLQTSGVPPFGTLDVPVTFNPANPLTNTKTSYTIRVAGVSSVKQTESELFFLTPIGIFSAIFVLIIIVGIIVLLRRK
jgi:transglutaminase-like putative cysteine protease